MSDIAEQLNVDDLTRRVREAVARQRPLHAAKSQASKMKLPRVPLALEPLEDKQSYSLDELLRYHDEEFIRAAFRAVLGHDADTGLPVWLESLRAGRRSKIEILGRMRYSRQGFARGARIAGLLPRFLIHRALRVPLAGRIAWTALHLARITKLVQRLDQLQGHVDQQLEGIRKGINGIAHAVEQGGSAELMLTPEWTESFRLQIENVFLLANQRLLAVQQSIARIDRLEHSSAGMESRLEKATVGVEKRLAEELQKRAVLEEELRALASHKDHLTRTLALLERQVSTLGRPAETVTEASGGAEVQAARGALDALYAALEDRFRGTRHEIRARAQSYVTLVRTVGAGTSESPVLDIGCGRGEWLEVLRDNGLHGVGVDSNSVMVEQCHERGLSVTHQDAVPYLEKIPSGSVAAVTAIHVVEHVPFEPLVGLIDEVVRVLKPGGVAIFETPNAENLMVGAFTFYYDPTHLHPLPSELLQFLVKARGFSRTEIKGLTENRTLPSGLDSPVGRADQLMTLPFDYALIAYKD